MRKLKPFRRIIAERYKGVEVGRQIGQSINEASEEMVISTASSVVIDDDVQPMDRKNAIDAFAKDIGEMNGKRIIAIAIAIACDY